MPTDESNDAKDDVATETQDGKAAENAADNDRTVPFWSWETARLLWFPILTSLLIPAIYGFFFLGGRGLELVVFAIIGFPITAVVVFVFTAINGFNTVSDMNVSAAILLVLTLILVPVYANAKARQKNREKVLRQESRQQIQVIESFPKRTRQAPPITAPVLP